MSIEKWKILIIVILFGSNWGNFVGYIFCFCSYIFNMLNYIWLFLISISFVCSVFNGTAAELSSSVFEGCADAVSLCLKLLGVMCFWSGLMNIAEKSGLCNVVAKILRPVLKRLFPGVCNNKEVMNAISMNVTANLFGLGNAATPLGIKAVKNMQRLNPDKTSVSPDMMTFVVINTAALKIIPSTVAALREAAGAQNPMDIIFCVWISSAFAVISAVVAVKIIGRFMKK